MLDKNGHEWQAGDPCQIIGGFNRGKPGRYDHFAQWSGQLVILVVSEHCRAIDKPVLVNIQDAIYDPSA